MARTLRDARLCTPGSAFVNLQNTPENETPKSALGDRKPKRRFRRQFPHTETSPYLQNAAEARGFERSFHVRRWRPDWLAGAAGLELRNVIANYAFEISHKFSAIQRNRRIRDFSRTSCGQRTHTRRGG
jgi:hypothetical protein